MQSLADLAVGQKAVIVNVQGPTKVIRRLLDMGMVPGAQLEVVKYAPFGDPVQIKIWSSSLALRKKEAQLVEVHVE